MSTRVLLLSGGEFHDFAAASRSLSRTLTAAGFEVTAANDASALSQLRGGQYQVVALYTQGDAYFSDQDVETLTQFVRNGGGLLGLHSATSTNKQTPAFTKLIGSRFVSHHPTSIDYTVSVSDADHPIAHRVQPFHIHDELYILEPCNEFRTFLTAWWDGTPRPQGYTRDEGKGKVVYLANGHATQALENPSWQKILIRSARYAAGQDWSQKTVKVAAIGYGGAFNMGKNHLDACARSRMIPVAVCDPDPARGQAARQELGQQIETYTRLDDLLDKSPADLCIIITPHDTHAPLAIQCLHAGRNVVSEKPFTVTVEEATRVIETARAQDRMASVFHNRRWDGDFLAMRHLVESGAIGDVFSIECFFGGFGAPRVDWWRSYKQPSGGAFYDWGAHFVDWVLQLMPHKIESISGSFHKRNWHQVSNEDHCEAFIRFEGGRTAQLQQSSIAAIGRARFRILGTQGGIEQWNEGGIKLVTYNEDVRTESKVPDEKSDWDAYYRNVADHLVLGEPLVVTPESARKVIAVLNLSEVSHQQGGMPIPLPFDQ